MQLNATRELYPLILFIGFRTLSTTTFKLKIPGKKYMYFLVYEITQHNFIFLAGFLN